MDRIRLGRTGLTVNKNGFGALPVQRVSLAEATALLQKAFDHGIDFFDTARAYSDSEEKLGAALSHVRDRLVIATKTAAVTAEGFWKDLEESLAKLRTDHVDIYQFHNPAFCPKPGDGSGLYEAMTEAKRQGKLRFIGITNHRLAVAKEAIASGLYDTVQFPFSYLSGPEDLSVVEAAAAADVGFIAMKALAGGLITDAALAYAFLNQYPVLPIWGVQRESELDQFLVCQEASPALTPERLDTVERDRRELAGEFCRGCGYCMPCPAGIEINNSARMSLLLRRSPSAGYFSPAWREKMARIEGCLDCGQCVRKCPYGLDTPGLLRKNYADYKTFLEG